MKKLISKHPHNAFIHHYSKQIYIKKNYKRYMRYQYYVNSTILLINYFNYDDSTILLINYFNYDDKYDIYKINIFLIVT